MNELIADAVNATNELLDFPFIEGQQHITWFGAEHFDPADFAQFSTGITNHFPAEIILLDLNDDFSNLIFKLDDFYFLFNFERFNNGYFTFNLQRTTSLAEINQILNPEPLIIEDDGVFQFPPHFLQIG